MDCEERKEEKDSEVVGTKREEKPPKVY